MSCFRPCYVTYNNGQFGKFGGRLSQDVLDAYADCPTDVVPVPCGKCIGCRLDRSKVWADRMLLEFNVSRDTYPAKTALFVTLTYDDDHLPRFECSDGMLRGNLDVRDTQLFLKRLRKFLPHKVRYFCAGEYGDTTFRPHYHMILFGCSLSDFRDLYLYSHDPALDTDLYESPTLDTLWRNGAVRFSTASYGTMAYVARYVIKKQYLSDNPLDFYRGRKPPFITMSRNPGIGADYFTGDFLDDDLLVPSAVVTDGDDVKICAIPRTYLNKIRLTNPELYDNIMSNRRALAAGKNDLVKDQIDINYFDFLKQSQRSLVDRTRILGRRDKI